MGSSKAGAGDALLLDAFLGGSSHMGSNVPSKSGSSRRSGRLSTIDPVEPEGKVGAANGEGGTGAGDGEGERALLEAGGGVGDLALLSFALLLLLPPELPGDVAFALFFPFGMSAAFFSSLRILRIALSSLLYDAFSVFIFSCL